jgi:RNA-directed DNA polymerase
MREPYVEGVANHDGPESCVGAREGVGEALTGVRAGRAVEPRNDPSSGCRRSRTKRKATPPAALAREPQAGPARSENQGTHGTSMRENREVPRPPAQDGGAGRGGKAEAASPR